MNEERGVQGRQGREDSEGLAGESVNRREVGVKEREEGKGRSERRGGTKGGSDMDPTHTHIFRQTKPLHTNPMHQLSTHTKSSTQNTHTDLH